MMLSIAALIGGLLVLAWSADIFVDGAVASARRLGMSPLLIGMVIMGFGTSAPEMVLSALAASEGAPALALGNAWGSNIANIGLVLGVTALLAPIAMHQRVLRRELPLLTLLTIIAVALALDAELERGDGWLLLLTFAVWMGLSLRAGMRRPNAVIAAPPPPTADLPPLGKAMLQVIGGLVLLVASSRLLVWGAVNIAVALGVSDLIIGLTVVAVGTSAPELAASIAAVRRNEHAIVIGNVIGSNIFNTLAVVGIAAAIHPLALPPEALSRDLPVMAALTLVLFYFAFNRPGGARISRPGGAFLLTAWLAYTAWLVAEVINAAG